MVIVPGRAKHFGWHWLFKKTWISKTFEVKNKRNDWSLQQLKNETGDEINE